ncbi:hypothetical protein BGZ51_000546 [Haplosporangium sp. Z 767]|nr:hypothetical protein BGZ51_000546 [Haplosporangium sp. Z 767]KAF9195691.1 hypothetical protein BGZ50_003861 [Haplosporangium sp. Z 11]
MPIARLFADDASVSTEFVNETTSLFCSMPFCSTTTVALIENTMSQNCAESTEDVEGIQWLYGFAALYVPFKQGICQRADSSSNSTYCITILTESLNAYVAKNPTKHGWDIFNDTDELQRYVDSMPNDMLCTPCNKAMINPLYRFIAVHQLTVEFEVIEWFRVLQVKIHDRCGASFVDGIAAPPPSTPTALNSSLSLSSFFRDALSIVGVGFLSLAMVFLA